MALASWPDSLPYLPDGDGWSNDLGIAPMAGDVDGPAAQQRSRPGDRMETITWQRAISHGEAAELHAFVAVTLRHGAARFWMPICLDGLTYGIRAVQIVAGSYRETGINNAQVRVTMSLTVYPPSWVPPVPVVVGLGSTVTGTAPAGATVELRVGATLIVGIANAGGAWSIGLPYMEGGTYIVQARIGDGPWSLPQYLTLAAPIYAEETVALFARMTVQPTGAVKQAMDTLVRTLLSDGTWQVMDALHIFAAHDAQAARLNWIADQYNLTAVNSPVFTAFRGYTGNGTSACLMSPANPLTLHSTPAANLKQNSAHMALWRLAAVFTATKGLMGCRESATRFFDVVQFGTITSFAARPNSGPAAGRLSVPASPGLFAMSRDGANAASYYWNGASLVTLAEASVVPPNATIAVLAQNVTGEGPSAFADDQLAFVSYGGALTPSQAAGLYAAVRTYLVAMGVPA